MGRLLIVTGLAALLPTVLLFVLGGVFPRSGLLEAIANSQGQLIAYFAVVLGSHLLIWITSVALRLEVSRCRGFTWMPWIVLFLTLAIGVVLPAHGR